MAKQGYTACATLDQMRNGQTVKLAGIVLIRQRPGSAKGVCFITVEDETGVANLVVWPKVMEEFRKVIMRARVIDVAGMVQRSEDVIHIVAHRLSDRSDALEQLSNDPMEPPLARADEIKKSIPHDPRGTHPRNHRIIPKSRDFH
jgi:error-prone DNA polymerase